MGFEGLFDRLAQTLPTRVAPIRHRVVLDLPEHRLDLVELRAVRRQKVQVQTPPSQAGTRRPDDLAGVQPGVIQNHHPGNLRPGQRNQEAKQVLRVPGPLGREHIEPRSLVVGSVAGQGIDASALRRLVLNQQPLAGEGPATARRQRGSETAFVEVGELQTASCCPGVRIPAAVAKARREQTVPLRSELVALLRTWLADPLPGDAVFAIPRDLIARFNADLARAGIAKRDDEGRTVDVHSLRTTFGTMLARSGVAPRVAMELMRHSRMELTQKVYVDPRLLPLAAAVEALPSVVVKVVVPGG